MGVVAGQMLRTCSALVNRLTVDWLSSKTRSELIVFRATFWVRTYSSWTWVRMMKLSSSLASEASSTALISWICAGGVSFSFLGQYWEMLPNLPHFLHLTLVILSRDLLVYDKDDGVPVDPSSFDFNVVFLSDDP